MTEPARAGVVPPMPLGAGRERGSDTGTFILGIDPGTALMGYGIVAQERGEVRCVTYGCLRTPADLSTAERLARLFTELEDLIARYDLSAMAVEELFFNVNTRTAISVAQARGVVLLGAARAGLTVAEYTPLQVKQAVVGYGRATKEQVQRMICALLHLPAPPRPDDAAYALAVAICHAHSARLSSVRDRR